MQENTFAHHSEAMNFISLINAYLAFFILLVFIRHRQMQNGSLIFWDLACFYRGSSVFAHKQLCVHTTDSLVFYLSFPHWNKTGCAETKCSLTKCKEG